MLVRLHAGLPLQPLYPLRKATQGTGSYIGESPVFQINRMRMTVVHVDDALALSVRNPAWHPNDYRIRGHILDYHGICANAGARADCYGAENLGAGPDHDIVLQRGVPFAFVPACAPESHAVIQRHVGANFSRLAYDDSHAVVDEEPGTYGCARVNFNPGAGPAEM